MKIKPGDIVRISCGDNFYYARRLNYEDFAFYDLKTKYKKSNLEEIISSPVLFKTLANNRGINDRLWEIIGNIPLEQYLQNSKYYLTDVIDANYFRIFENGEYRVATKQECIGLEIHAIWDPIHLCERFKDHYLSKENLTLKTLDVLGNYRNKIKE